MVSMYDRKTHVTLMNSRHTVSSREPSRQPGQLTMLRNPICAKPIEESDYRSTGNCRAKARTVQTQNAQSYYYMPLSILLKSVVMLPVCIPLSTASVVPAHPILNTPCIIFQLPNKNPPHKGSEPCNYPWGIQ